jgi:hypothetical protein
MVLSETIIYATLFALTVVFTAFALVIRDKLWRVALKFIAGLFWIIMAITQFFFVGSSSMFLILSLPYAIFGLIFWIAILNDFLGDKKNRIWNFDDI